MEGAAISISIAAGGAPALLFIHKNCFQPFLPASAFALPSKSFGGNTVAILFDLGVPYTSKRIVADACKTAGQPDILLNNVYSP
jgi:hypothetical protein